MDFLHVLLRLIAVNLLSKSFNFGRFKSYCIHYDMMLLLYGFIEEIMHSKDAEKIANSVDLDQRDTPQPLYNTIVGVQTNFLLAIQFVYNESEIYSYIAK